MSIIAISGKIGSGKDTVGTIIQYLVCLNKEGTLLPHQKDFNEFKHCGISNQVQSGWQIKKFADALKEICSRLTGIPREDFEKQEVKDSFLGDEWTHKNQNWYWAKAFEVYAKEEGKTLEAYIEEGLKEGRLEIQAKDGEEYVYRHTYLDQKRTVRWLLQTVGTEAMREHVHNNVWVNALFADYKSFHTKTLYDFMKEKLNVHQLNDNYYFSTKDTYQAEWNEKCLVTPNWIITDMRFPNELEAVRKRNGITIRIERLMTGYDYEKKAAMMNHPSETSLDNSEFSYRIYNNGTIEELVEKVKDILIKEKII